LFAGKNAFQSNGTYQPGPGCDGFTCASLIAEIFRQIGFTLVDLTTWEPRKINEAWGNAIVCMLVATKVSPSHVEKVSSNISNLRLRPEEVAASAELPLEARPAIYPKIVDRADELFAQINSACGPPPDSSASCFKHCVSTYRIAVLLSLGARRCVGRRKSRQRFAPHSKSKIRGDASGAPRIKCVQSLARWSRTIRTRSLHLAPKAPRLLGSDKTHPTN
jgi:hypothetical protein